ncbi:hypothetical protein BC828DRAFT_389400 [Blastocladiella britannica]|nr:hypothetical protein BC828DRAFT_389400 [Blastocladiella britannica]
MAQDNTHLAVAVLWSAAAVSTVSCAIDLAMIGHICTSSNPQQNQRQRNRHHHPVAAARSSPFVVFARLFTWITFLVADLAHLGTVAAFLALPVCGGVPTNYGLPTLEYRRFPSTPNCIISLLDAVDLVVALIFLPYYPIVYMHMMLKLRQTNSRLAQLTVSLVSVLLLTAAGIQAVGYGISITPTFGGDLGVAQRGEGVGRIAYYILMLLILLVAVSTISFFVRFLRIVSARVASQPSLDHHSQPASITPSLELIQRSKLLLLRPFAEQVHAAPAPTSDRTAKFRTAIHRLQALVHVSVALIALLVGVMVIQGLWSDGSALIVATITCIGRILLAIFHRTITSMRPLMILRRQIPTVDAGTLATEWSGADPPQQ